MENENQKEFSSKYTLDYKTYKEFGVLGNNFIELKIKNEEKYLNNISFVKKMLINSNKKMGHQIVCITLNTTKYSINEVMKKIKEYRVK